MASVGLALILVALSLALRALILAGDFEVRFELEVWIAVQGVQVGESSLHGGQEAVNAGLQDGAQGPW